MNSKWNRDVDNDFILISQKHSEFISWWFRVKNGDQGEFDSGFNSVVISIVDSIVNSYWNREADSELKVNSGKNSEIKEKLRSR